MSFNYEDSLLRGNQRQRFNRRKRISSSSSSPNPQDDINYYSAHLIGAARCLGSDDFGSFHMKPHRLRDDAEKITEFERSYFGPANSEKIRRGKSQSPSFMNRHSTFSSDSDSCSSISNMMTDCAGPEMTSSDSDDPDEVIYPEEQLNHVREFMARRSLRLMTEEQMTRYPIEGRGCVCSNSMDSGYKSFGASPDVNDHSFDVRSERGRRQHQSTRQFLHPDPCSEVPFSRCPITTNQRFMARYKNNSLDNRLNSSLADFETRNVPMGLYEAKMANRLRSRQMDAHLDHLLHLRRTLMTAIQRVESTSPRSSKNGSPVVTSRSTSPAVTVISRNMKTVTPNSSPFIQSCNSPARSSSEVGARPRRLLPTPGQRIQSSPKSFHSPQLNDIRRVIRTSKMLDEEKSGSSETSSVTSSAESTANSNSMSLHSSDVTFSSFQELHTRNVPSLLTHSPGNAGNLMMERQSLAIPRSETSGYSTGKEDVEQVSDFVQEEEDVSVSNTTQNTLYSRSSKSAGHFSGVSTLERNFKSLLRDEDDTRLLVDLENFNPSKVPEALKMRPNQESKSTSILGSGGEEVLKTQENNDDDERRGNRILKKSSGDTRRLGGGSKTLMDDKENGSSRIQCEQVCLTVVPEGGHKKKGRGSVSPRSQASEGSNKESGERMRHPSSSTRESIIKLEALSASNALMFKCAAAASMNKHNQSLVSSSSCLTNSPKARTIVPPAGDKEVVKKDTSQDIDHRKLSPPHINAILDKHLRRKKSRSACSTPKKPPPEEYSSDAFKSKEVI